MDGDIIGVAAARFTNRANRLELSLRKNGAPEEIRTPDPQIRSLVLYPAELRVLASRLFVGVGDPLKRDALECKRPLEKKSHFAVTSCRNIPARALRRGRASR
jgi:hypothetical protein